MNIQFQICGLCILLLMLVFYKSHENLHLYQEKVFFMVLCIMTASLIFDILTIVAIKLRFELPPLLVTFICKTYISTLIWVIWSAIIYIVADLTPPQKHKRIVLRSTVIPVLQCVIVYLLPIYIYDRDGQVYTYGPAVLCIYAFVALHIIVTLAVTFIHRKTLNPRKKFAMVLWMLIWTLGAAIQFFHNALLLVGFAGSLGVLILFVIMENPEGNIERQLGCFNSYALSEYLKQLYGDGSPFSLLLISFETAKAANNRSPNVSTATTQITRLCGEQTLVFKNTNSGLILIDRDAETLRNIQNSALKCSEDHRCNLEIISVPQADGLSDQEELFRFLSFVGTEYHTQKGGVILADSSMVLRYKSRFAIEQEIHLALAQDRVEVFLQPIYSTRDKRFTSAEALVRIRKEDGGFLSPQLFIPVAEKNGQITELGDRVFEKVCWILQNSDVVKLGVQYIEINLSVVQCERENLSQRLIDIAEKYRINPRRINFEITETASVSAQNILLENMKKLIDYGFSFSLDDFGKGQSNLMYVVKMPVSIIKLDAEMSKEYFTEPKAKQVVRAVCNMSHRMGLKIVAEGIETREENEQIIREDIDYIQGFYYSNPLPLQDFLKFIAKQDYQTPDQNDQAFDVYV